MKHRRLGLYHLLYLFYFLHIFLPEKIYLQSIRTLKFGSPRVGHFAFNIHSYKMSWTIAIPSYKRADQVVKKSLATLKRYNIPSSQINIFVEADQVDEYKEAVGSDAVVVSRGHCSSIMEARNKIINHYAKGKQFIFMDDDVTAFKEVKGKKLVDLPSLKELINRGFALCKKHGFHLWGVYPAANAFYMKSDDEYSTTLKFIVGAFMGVINQKILVNTQHNKEDYLLSILYYLKDGGVIRFNKVAVRFGVGQKGGIDKDDKGRMKIQKDATNFLVDKYPTLVRKNPQREGEVLLNKAEAETPTRPDPELKGGGRGDELREKIRQLRELREQVIHFMGEEGWVGSAKEKELDDAEKLLDYMMRSANIEGGARDEMTKIGSQGVGEAQKFILLDRLTTRMEKLLDKSPTKEIFLEVDALISSIKKEIEDFLSQPYSEYGKASLRKYLHDYIPRLIAEVANAELPEGVILGTGCSGSGKPQMRDDVEKSNTERKTLPIRNKARYNEAKEKLLEVLRRSTVPRIEKLREGHHSRANKLGTIGRTTTFGFGDTRHGIKEYATNKKNPELLKALADFGNTIVPLGWEYNGITLNHGVKAKKHKDTKNLGDSVIIGIGDFTGGDIEVWDENDKDPKIFSLHDKPVMFNGGLLFHQTTPFKGERYTMIFYKQLWEGDVKGVRMRGRGRIFA